MSPQTARLVCRVSPPAGSSLKPTERELLKTPGGGGAGDGELLQSADCCRGAERRDGVLLTDALVLLLSPPFTLLSLSEHTNSAALIPSPPSLRFIKSFFPPF